MKHSFPILHYPTTTVFIDDDYDFIKSLFFFFKQNESFVSGFEFFNNEEKALEFINQSPSHKDILKSYIGVMDENLWQHKQIDLNFNDLHKVSHNENRFREVSVVVVDYEMPNINGIDFAKKIKNKGIKTILLTGEADETAAIEAFNEGLIDRYLKKENPKMSFLIEEFIKQLQLESHLETTSLFKEAVKSEQEESAYSDLNYIEFLNTYFTQNKFCEIYPFETNGSSLFVKEDGKVNLIYVATADQIDSSIETYMDPENSNIELLKSLENHQKMICPYNPLTGNIVTCEKEIFNNIHPTKMIEGDLQNYYYCEIEGLSDKKIAGFKDFRDMNTQKYSKVFR